jgi:uncharacterized protein (DUF1015 family)
MPRLGLELARSAAPRDESSVKAYLMAEICPFRALHYNQHSVPSLEKVITQPYDKINAEMQARYYELSPYNLVRIIRRRPEAEADNVYARAAHDFRSWIESRILLSAAEPAIYPYYQEYSLPDEPGGRGSTKTRRGFIALLRLEDYAAGVVHRHEETLSGPKADRLELLKAARAHFGQIFMLYSDPRGDIEAELAPVTRAKPWERLPDEYGAVHSVWRATDPALIERVVEAMRPHKLVIADGHHRYETALTYRDYCRNREGAATVNDQRAEYVMATFVRMEADGLTILPTHRVVHGLPGFDWDRFAAAAKEYFDLEALPLSGQGAGSKKLLREKLAAAGSERPAIGVYATPAVAALLRLDRGLDLGRLLPEVPEGLARLDVVLVHRLLLERALGIDRQAVREERNLRYLREFAAALEEVDRGKAQICFLMNPTPIEAVRDNALAGHVLPQKSTDFYPKLLSGLTVYWLDNPAGI